MMIKKNLSSREYKVLMALRAGKKTVKELENLIPEISNVPQYIRKLRLRGYDIYRQLRVKYNNHETIRYGIYHLIEGDER